MQINKSRCSTNVIRALRLAFLSASVLPFIFGSIIKRQNFNFPAFFFGLMAVAFTHSSANLINDYADALSGVDWQDKNFYKFFGGSKLIQEGVLPERFYLKTAVTCAAIAALCVIALSAIMHSPLVILVYLCVIFLSWSYSAKPFRFSYHRMGEFFIFILFGPVLVMAGYFIQTSIFPDSKSFFLSLPFGFLTTAVLFANEVPDFASDSRAGKLTWVSICKPQRAFLWYSLLMILAFLAVLLNIFLGYLKVPAILSFIFIVFAIRAAIILKKYPKDKVRLMESSKLTIATHAFVSMVLILAVL